MSIQLEQQVAALQLDLKTALAKIEMIANQPEPLSAWFSGGVALVAVFIAGCMSWLQIRQANLLKERELQANVIADSRKEWAREVRDTTKRILAQLSLIRNFQRLEGMQSQASCLAEYQLQLARLELLMDPGKSEHKELIVDVKRHYAKTVQHHNSKMNRTVDRINLDVQDKELADDEISRLDARNRFISRTQSLLEENWERIQKYR